VFKTDVSVRFNDCDALGHVNNSLYFTYMEEARTPIFAICNPDLSVGQWNLIVASARCDFLRQIHYGHQMIVMTWVSRIKTSSFTVDHLVVDGEGLVYARGQAVLIYYDYTSQKPTPLPQSIREQLAEHGVGPEQAPAFRD